MSVSPSIGIIGSGTWAVALTRVLVHNQVPVFWWIRNEERLRFFVEHGYNRDYLPAVHFSEEERSLWMRCSSDIAEVIQGVDTLLIVMPSPFVEHTLEPIRKEIWGQKTVISATKGLIGKDFLQMQRYLGERFGLGDQEYVAITGPSHAEEISAKKCTFLTFASTNQALIHRVCPWFAAEHIQQRTSPHVVSAQYVGVLKNVYAIAVGMGVALGYGDNFKSVIVSNVSNELFRILAYVCAKEKCDIADFFSSMCLGDLLVTCYSEYSRNQRLGKRMVEGKTAHQIFQETKMVAEGYFAAKWVEAMASQYPSFANQFPIATTTARILEGTISPKQGFEHLISLLC